MDYCSTCRRHLNGALVCPGCGAYAPDIAPATSERHFVPTPVAAAGTGPAAAPESTAWEPWHDGRLRGEADEALVGGGTEWVPRSNPSGDLESSDIEDVPSVPQGRAARRRQRARWKKNQRRAVVATAVALVGGGLTLASTNRQSGDQTQAATAPAAPGTNAAEEQGAARSTSTEPDAQRVSPTPPAHSPAPEVTQRRYTTASLYTTPPKARPDAAAPPRTTVSDQEPQSAATSSGTTVSDRTDTANTTATTPAQTPAPAATDGTDSGTSQTGTTQTGTSQTSTEATTNSPQICLLVLCLG
jgi:hypothetical protein